MTRRLVVSQETAMNFDQLYSEGSLKGLPMRASLKATGEATPSWSTPAWRLVSEWNSPEVQPLLVGTRLRVVALDGCECCVVHGEAITPCEGNPIDEDYRAFVYLLNPADRCVWEAIDSWVKVGCIASYVNPRTFSGESVVPQDLEVLELRGLEGAELDSDTLAGAIEKLLEAGQLEAELARQLDIKVPLYCTVVETPMMLKSLQPPSMETMEEWRAHKERELNRGLNEDIWS
jgi:hypothetical protein